MKRSVAKLDQSTGNEIWSMTDFGDSQPFAAEGGGHTGGFGLWKMVKAEPEFGNPNRLIRATVTPTPTAGVVTFSGLYQKPTLTEVKVKSGGNTFGGKAIVVTMSIASLSSNTVPTFSDIATTKVYAGYHSAKTAHFMDATKVAVYYGRIRIQTLQMRARKVQRSRLSTSPTTLNCG
jgi:hypothetical protein